MIPPEISATSKKTTAATQVVTESTPTTTAKETITNEVMVQPDVDNQHRRGCKEGEFLPSSNCNKVSTQTFNWYYTKIISLNILIIYWYTF